ncbi:MAG TPA: neuraminidase-like domain-containing protein [Kofleriaceae bacterium]|jgi:hypothetical protein|nr:neuraminidase-like domain-containing protein [Kofleriaceae bacterium]
MFIDKSQIKTGMTGELVAQLHQRLVLMGFEIAADELQSDRYGGTTETAVRRFQVSHGLPVTDGWVDEATSRGLGLGGYPKSIDGVVCRPDGTILTNVAVRLYQHGGGSEQVLAQTRSGDDGKFSLPWPAGLRGGLHVQAEGSEARPVSWKSGLTTDVVWLRISVGGAYRGPTRFSVLGQALAPATEARGACALGGAGRGAELADLGEALRVPADDVSRFVLAHKLAGKTSIDPAVFYALLVHTVTPETIAALAGTRGDAQALDDAHVDHALDMVLTRHRDDLRAGLAKAVADNTIADIDVDAAADQLHALRVEHVAARPLAWTPPETSDDHACCAADGAPEPSGPSVVAEQAAAPTRIGDAVLRDLIATAVADPPAQRAVLGAFAAHRDHTPLRTVLDAAMAAGLRPAQRGDVQFVLDAAALIGHHLPLVAHVRRMRTAGRIAMLSDLARLDHADWAGALREVDPGAAQIRLPALSDRPAGERIDHAAGILAQRFERRFPTAALIGRLAKSPAALGLSHARDIAHFLDRASTFCVRHSHIDRFLQEVTSDGLPAGADRDAAVSELKTLQRAYKLTPRFDHAKAILDAGHRGAYSIHAVGPEQFARQMSAAGVAAADSQDMFARAEQMHATALTLMGNFHASFVDAMPAAVAPQLDAAAIARLASLPTLNTLFGTGDYCACSECRSVHGPAAYLVDMLEFLKSRAGTASGTTARSLLFARRPDLQFIQLSCDNTNDVVPYVDLVCEILEDAVGSAPANADVKKRQTTGTEDELRANPAFVRDSAYTTLLAAAFPITAPFDLYGSEVRAFFGRLGVPRNQLMAAFQVGSTPADVDIAAERFGFGKNAIAFVTTAAPSNPWTLWNLTATGNTVTDPRDPTKTKTGTNIAIMSYVPILLNRAQVSHRELLQLFEARFVNPGQALTLFEGSVTINGVASYASCDIGNQSVTGWTDALLTGFNRFIRLWRQLGCTVWDLDKVLAAPQIANGTLDVAAVTKLAQLDAVADRLKLPWDELLTLWGPIDSIDYVNLIDSSEPTVLSVYKRKFRNSTVTQATTSFTDDPGSLSGNLDNVDVIAGISAALDISAADIAAIRGAVTSLQTTGGTPPALNTTNLSIIVRYATMAAALDLSIADLLTAIAITNVNPFPTDASQLTPALTLQFLAAFDEIANTGFTLRELDYLLRHGSPVDSKLGLPDATIAGWLDDLRKELVRLGASPSSDAVTALVTQRISAMLPLDLALAQQIVQAQLPGSSQTIAAQFVAAVTSLTTRDSNNAFTTASSRGNFGGLYDAYTAIDKARIVLTRWRVNTADARWLLQNAGTAGWLQLHTLPGHAGASTPATFALLDTLHRNVVVQQTLASPTGTRLFDFVLAPGLPPGGTGTATLANGVANVAMLGGWSTADINALATRFNWTTAGQLVADATVARIRDLMAWPRKLGTDVATTLLFAGATVGSDESRKARQLAKAMFSTEEWLGVAGSIQDGLREQKRAALVAYLLANPQPARNQTWITIEDLYGFFLIDPEMSPATTTTRVKQATASVQLFVQRCFLQLEALNTDSDSLWNQWNWMKQFRLWEANRKIFLYPENWYDPSQRLDTSPYFEDMIDEIQQTSLTDDVAEDALRNYLHKLADVAHLEISGIWEDPQPTGLSVLHVVARTRKAPYVYSYRRRQSTGAWSAWEPLDGDSNANHIMPAIWNQRLFMFWPEFVEKALPGVDDDTRVPPVPANPSTTVSRQPTKYFEIALSWLERRSDIWLPKRTSQRKQLLIGTFNPGGSGPGTGAPLLKQQVAFRISMSQRGGTNLNNLVMSLYEPTGGSTSPALAQWILSSSQDEPVLLNSVKAAFPTAVQGQLEDLKYLAPFGTGSTLPLGARPTFNGNLMSFNYNAFGGDTPNVNGALLLTFPTGTQLPTQVASTITMARVISVRYGDASQFSSPFFISDPQRTFFGTFDSHSGAWTLQSFFHPYVDMFLQQLNQGGIPGLYSRVVQVYPDSLRGMASPFDFAGTYGTSSNPAGALATPLPTETIDYTQPGPYALYNWELFLHLPLLIAKRLADNQRFEEALTWFHYIFNPMTVFDPVPAPVTGVTPVTPSAGSIPARFWNPKVFRDLGTSDYATQTIEQQLALVNQANGALMARVADWRNDPFDPNLVAAARPVAYQKAVVMAYISTLVAWGDQLFRGDTIESINEATQLYLLASQLLGPRPQSVRSIQPAANNSYDDLKASIDTFSNVLVQIENIVSVPPPATPLPNGVTPPTPTPLNTFYFCIPPNDQMLSYWDLVADRLFKIRHGMNIDGVSRPLSLFDSPIDPGVLARAAAAGVDIAAVLSDAAVNVGCYRFQTLWQAAHDLCQDVRGLGSAILSALDRRDGEEMARLRASQEVAVTTAVRDVKARQLDEANANKTALQSTRAMAQARKDFYSSREFMNANEALAQDLNTQAQHNEEAAQQHDRRAVWEAWLPSTNIGVSGFGGSPVATLGFGTENLRMYVNALTAVLRGEAGINSRKAGLSSTLGGYLRRQDDWNLQATLATNELAQIDAQLAAADLRIAIAQHELDIQDLQIANATANAELLQTKFTNQELYDWMVSQLSSTYFNAYQLAYDLAKRASKAYTFEVAKGDPGFIQFGYWDSLHKGLVAGDKLLLDLRRLQAAHLNNNTRELEVTKHVSLLRLDPQALVRLRETGACDITLPEALFDAEHPGHFYRRLKAVSVTLPCVTGPYTGVNATLTQLDHTIRTTLGIAGGYLPSQLTNGLGSDTRFSYVSSSAQSIALSTGRDDAGMFEVILRDERYLPFEGTGAISRWHLDLQQQDNQFDVSTLSDVVLHVRYTARSNDSDDERSQIRGAYAAVSPAPIGVQLLSARTEFPDAYARLFAPTGSGQRLDLALAAEHFPFVPASQQITVTGIRALVTFTNDNNYSDYVALDPGKRLTAHIGFTPNDGSVPTTSVPFGLDTAHLGNVPVTTAVALSGAIAPVTVAFVESELAGEATLLVQPETQPDSTVLHRLIRDKIDDILIAVSFQVGPKT